MSLHISIATDPCPTCGKHDQDESWLNIPRSTDMDLAMLVSMHVARRGFDLGFKRIRKTKPWQRFVPIWRRSWYRKSGI